MNYLSDLAASSVPVLVIAVVLALGWQRGSRVLLGCAIAVAAAGVLWLVWYAAGYRVVVRDGVVTVRALGLRSRSCQVADVTDVRLVAVRAAGRGMANYRLLFCTGRTCLVSASGWGFTPASAARAFSEVGTVPAEWERWDLDDLADSDRGAVARWAGAVAFWLACGVAVAVVVGVVWGW